MSFIGSGRRLGSDSTTITLTQERLSPNSPSAQDNQLPTEQASAAQNPIPSSVPHFTIAIACALKLEYNALSAALDNEPDVLAYDAEDDFIYTTALFARRRVIISYPAREGQLDTALALQLLEKKYGKMRLIILLGICAGIPRPQMSPSREKDTQIFLGDVIISTAVLTYAHAARISEGRWILRETVPAKAQGTMRRLLDLMGTDPFSKKLIRQSTDPLEKVGLSNPKYRAPLEGEDICFPPRYPHLHRSNCPTNVCAERPPESSIICDAAMHMSCKDLHCDTTEARHRPSYKDRPLNIHSGIYASADAVMRSAEVRDDLAKKHDVLAFDMEATGIWSISPNAVVIKGVCDYGDSHKSKAWQDFAAARAACVAIAFITNFFPEATESQPSNPVSLTPLEAVTPSCLETSPNLSTNYLGDIDHSSRYAQTSGRIKVISSISVMMSDWVNSKSGENLLLWGTDYRGWLLKAMRQIAYTFTRQAKRPVILLDCEAMIEECPEDSISLCFLSELRRGIVRSLTPDTPTAYKDALRHLDGSIILDIDKRLHSLITVLISGIHVLPLESTSGDDRCAIECIEALLGSVNFSVLIAGEYEIESLGNVIPETTSQKIGMVGKATAEIMIDID